MDFCKYVNVFHGCAEIDLPKPYGVAATWHFIKAITGNTSPGATLPFGKYSCCMYTTAYPGGYGDHYPNCCPEDLRFLEGGAKFHGLSHFHQSGTGAIDYYYNYAVTMPFFGIEPPSDGSEIISESAQPGYYSVVSGGEILSEATVSERSVYHRFTFPRSGGKIAIDFSNNGLFKIHENQYSRPQSGRISILSPDTVCAEVVLDGLKNYFYYRVVGAEAVSLLKNNETICGSMVEFSTTQDTYGVLFDALGCVVTGRMSISIKNTVLAFDELNDEEGSFDTIKNKAYEKWNEKLGRVIIETSDERLKGIFYSNLYHSLVKPADRSGECPLWKDDGFVVDFSTLWDTYKTELPLIFTLYPEIGRKIINTVFDSGKHLGKLPHTFVLCDGFMVNSSQACMLAEHTVCDAFYRNIPADYERLLSVLIDDINRDSYDYLRSDSLPSRLTHLLDAAEACGAVAELAYRIGNPYASKKLEKRSKKWRLCFDAQTGLLKKDFDYYEGNFWNYSFRLMREMSERIDMAGGKEKFVKLLDRFFGFTYPESKQTRFEGFNNESDMESPYAYNYVDRIDRTCEVISAANRSMFTDGRGGLPGNNDSGGLSSCYVWNSIGIFPVTGQDLMQIGTPLYDSTVLHLAGGKSFTIIRKGEGIYTKKASLNGRELTSFSFKASEMMNGGTLVLTCEMEP